MTFYSLETIEELQDLFDKYGVLYFRGEKITRDNFIKNLIFKNINDIFSIDFTLHTQENITENITGEQERIVKKLIKDFAESKGYIIKNLELEKLSYKQSTYYDCNDVIHKILNNLKNESL